MGELVTRHLTYRYLGLGCASLHTHTHTVPARNYTIALLHVFNKSDTTPAQGREGGKTKLDLRGPSPHIVFLLTAPRSLLPVLNTPRWGKKHAGTLV